MDRSGRQPAHDKGNIAAVIQLQMLEARQFSECPPMTLIPPTIQRNLHTEKGDIVIELFADKAPWL